MLRALHPEVARGGSGHAQCIAPRHRRYIGMYYWCAYWRHWDKIISVDDRQWTVQQVDLNGQPVGEVRSHCTAMEARHFADAPFRPRSKY